MGLTFCLTPSTSGSLLTKRHLPGRTGAFWPWRQTARRGGPCILKRARAQHCFRRCEHRRRCLLSRSRSGSPVRRIWTAAAPIRFPMPGRWRRALRRSSSCARAGGLSENWETQAGKIPRLSAIGRAAGRQRRRYNRQCQELEALEQAGRLVVISPSVDLQVTRLEGDMEKLGRLYWMGNQDANAQLERLRTYLV